DGLTWTFKLQRNVKFHDGKPFTSADVKFSVEKIVRPLHSRGRANFRDLRAAGAFSVGVPAHRGADLPAASPRERERLPEERVQPSAGGDRSLQAHRVGAGKLPRAGKEPRLLEAGAAVSGPHHLQGDSGWRRPGGGAGDG